MTLHNHITGVKFQYTVLIDKHPSKNKDTFMVQVHGKSIEYTREIPRTCPIFIQAWGSIWEFMGKQNNRGSSDVYVTYVYCGLSMKI